MKVNVAAVDTVTLRVVSAERGRHHRRNKGANANDSDMDMEELEENYWST